MRMFFRRRELGLTLRELVDRAGIAEPTVTGALYGYHEGSVRTWWIIARALNMPTSSLMSHLDDPGTNLPAPSSSQIAGP